MERFKRFLREEGGAASVLEAAFVYPVVILVVSAMIFLGVYVSEAVFLEVRAQRAADTAAKTIVFSGYSKLGDIYSAEGFPESGKPPGKSRVNAAYEDGHPYRYLGRTGSGDECTKKVQESAENMILKSGRTECHTEIRRHLSGREVTVTVERTVLMPGFFRAAGLDDVFAMNISASALTYDPAEFIRNTDLTADAAEYLAEKTGAGAKLSEIREKISALLENFSAGRED